jgi:SAM-dependent methyltransferase
VTENEILDPTCGGKTIWMPEQRDRDDVLWIDKRERESGFNDQEGREYGIQPDRVGDFRDLDIPDDSKNLVVFDPPHMTAQDGMDKLTGYVEQNYGALRAETWQHDIRKGFEEFWRVLSPGGSLVMKWADNHIDFTEVLDVLPETPLFGTRTRQSNKSETRWFVFYKPERKVQQSE